MEIFYCPEILSGKNELSEDESYHCVKVLRHKEDDEITLTDGAGSFYSGRIMLASKSKCLFEILDKHAEEFPLNINLHLAIAPTKNNDRMEWLCEKAVEVGVSEISFLECEHSERRKINLERMQRICVSAMKQSGRATVPKLNNLISFIEFLSSIKNQKESSKFICHLGENNISLSSVYKNGNALIMIGPEGDFTNEELNLAKSSGFVEVILGNSRLRTETAALTAVIQIHLLNSKNQK